MLLRVSDGRLSDSELRDNLITLLLAGHETTATALAWAWHELAREPGLQRLDLVGVEVLGDADGLDARVVLEHDEVAVGVLWVVP